MDKRIFVFSDLCNGCRNCEMWCSFRKRDQNEFNASYSIIRIVRDIDETFDEPMVNCTAKGCPLNEEGEPICVEVCPTGALAFTDSEDAYQKKIELAKNRRVQPMFKLIAPWKYPYPWTEWPKEGV